MLLTASHSGVTEATPQQSVRRSMTANFSRKRVIVQVREQPLLHSIQLPLPLPSSISPSKNHVTWTVMSLSKRSFFRQPKPDCLSACVHNADSHHHHHVLGYGNCFL